MLQLAIAEEFAGNEDGAVKWYGQIVDSNFLDPHCRRKPVVRNGGSSR